MLMSFQLPGSLYLQEPFWPCQVETALNALGDVLGASPSVQEMEFSPRVQGVGASSRNEHYSQP